jgi:hypothetical protein
MPSCHRQQQVVAFATGADQDTYGVDPVLFPPITTVAELEREQQCTRPPSGPRPHFHMAPGLTCLSLHLSLLQGCHG